MLYEKICFGISSRTYDNKHIFMYDFDIENKNNCNVELMYDDLIKVQNDFDLSCIYILNTTNGYNAFSLDKLEFSELTTLLLTMKYVDGDFIKYAVKRGYYTLRMSKDKEVIQFLIRKNNKEKSLAHLTFFNDVMGYNIDEYGNFKNFDIYTWLQIIAYKSYKHGVNNDKLQIL